MKRYLFSYLIFVLMITSVYSATSLECEFKNSCSGSEVPFLYANKNFNDSNGEVLSSNVAIKFDSNYNQVLCCKSAYGQLNVSFINKNSTCNDGNELMYFTDSINSRVRFPDFEILNNRPFETFDINDYTYKSCVKKSKDFGLFDIIASDRDYSIAGYTCMYKINDLENGVVSSCNASFSSSTQYKYTVWGRLWEDISSLKCNLDCTSKLDGRVYAACATQIEACRGIPDVCNGVLINTWVPTNNLGEELFCAAPWTLKRSASFTNEEISISSKADNCNSIISKNFPVVLDNKQVNLKIYVCED